MVRGSGLVQFLESFYVQGEGIVGDEDKGGEEGTPHIVVFEDGATFSIGKEGKDARQEQREQRAEG